MDNLVTPSADPSVAPLVAMFEESESVMWEERRRNERDRDYYDGKQLTDAEIAALKKRKQPPVKFNRIRRKVNFLLGLERQSRKDPKAFPRNPVDTETADAATDAIRFVCDREDWDAKRSEVWENMLVEGTGALMVGIKKTPDGLDPELTHIPWDRLFIDPHSRKPDASDAAYIGIVTWYDYEEAKATWPDSEDALTATLASTRYTETYDDRPKWKVWADPKRKRVRVIELYYRRAGAWMTCTFTEKGHLVKPSPSPYMDRNGQPECPIKVSSLYVDRENNRYGDVRDMIDPQDEINKRRSKALHFAMMRQIRLSEDSRMTAEQARREAARPDGVLFGTGVEILSTNDLAQANVQLMQEAKGEIDLQGANAALQGKNENDMSGRAILAQQQGGMVEVALHMDRLRQFTLKVYEAIWSRIRQVWQAERWVRVTDNENNVRFVGFNQPVTAADMLREQLASDPQAQQAIATDPNAQARFAMFIQGPQSQMVVGMRNVPAQIDVDLVIDEGMDTPTIQAEQFDTLTKVLPGIINLPPMYAKMLIQASSLRDKDEILESMEQAQQQAANDPMQQQMAQLQLAGQAAEIDKTASEAQENRANAIRNEAEVVKAGFEMGAAA